MSTFTDWNGPQGGGGGVSSKAYTDLLREYTVLSNTINQHINASALADNDVHKIISYTKQALEAKQDKLSFATGVSSGDNNVLTSDIVYRELEKYQKKLVFDNSPTEFNTEHVVSSDALYTLLARKQDKMEAAIWDASKISMSSSSDSYINAEVLTQCIKYLNEEATRIAQVAIETSFTDDTEFVHDLITVTKAVIQYIDDVEVQTFKYREFTAPVTKINRSELDNIDDHTLTYIIGMCDKGAGTAFIKYRNSHPFDAKVDFAFTDDTDSKAGSLDVVVSAPSKSYTRNEVRFVLVEGTDAQSVNHTYLGICVKAGLFVSTDGIGVLPSVQFKAAGINFYPVGSRGYIAPNGATSGNILATRYTDNSNYDNSIGAIMFWKEAASVQLDDGTQLQKAVNFPELYLACDGSEIPSDSKYNLLRARIGDTLPVVDYGIISACLS